MIDANPTLGMDENQLLKMFMGKFNKMNEEVSFARYFIYYIFNLQHHPGDGVPSSGDTRQKTSMLAAIENAICCYIDIDI